jgi:hypothetical protein
MHNSRKILAFPSSPAWELREAGFLPVKKKISLLDIPSMKLYIYIYLEVEEWRNG